MARARGDRGEGSERGPAPGAPRRADSRGFTLIELLVVCAVVAALTGVLVPSLGGARAAAREAACKANQRRLHLAMMASATSSDGRIPGVNTTNAQYLRPLAAQALLGDTSASAPTTTMDWISPILGADLNLSVNRAERTRQIFDVLGCPSARRENDLVWGVAGDSDDFNSVLGRDGYPQVSYLSPAAFHLAGHGYRGGDARFVTWGWQGPAVPPRDYLPRLDRVGPPSMKVFVADGCRYLAAPNRLDFDMNPNPQYFSSFLTGSPIYVASREYGGAAQNAQFPGEHQSVQSAGSIYPHNARLSYRHKGGMVAVCFDGSAGKMSEADSKADATPWYPADSEFTGVRATPGALSRHRAGDILP